jgi:hypothetical protein
VAALALVPSVSRASLITTESFDYGAVAGNLAGKNGGSGFSSGWSGASNFQYTPVGLTFGSLLTSGGASSYTGTGFTQAIERPFATTLPSVIYGAELFRVDSQSSAGSNNLSLLLGQSGQSDTQTPFALLTPTNSSVNPGRVRIQGLGRDLTGAASAPTVGTTFLALFKFDTTGTPTATAWVLTNPQYENFISGGLQEATLNAAAIGTGATDVWARASLTINVALGTMPDLRLFGFNTGLSETQDEIRLSNTSLAEAAPHTPAAVVPEPATVCLFGVGIACLLVHRRKRGGAL